MLNKLLVLEKSSVSNGHWWKIESTRRTLISSEERDVVVILSERELDISILQMLKVLRGEPYSSVASPVSIVVPPPDFTATAVSCDSGYSSSMISGLSSISPSQLLSQRGKLGVCFVLYIEGNVAFCNSVHQYMSLGI